MSAIRNKILLNLFLLTLTIRLTLTAQLSVKFAVIGDYGFDSQPETDVANLLKSWNPDFIITTGDNNYNYGEASTIDANIGKHYNEFISPYNGTFGSGDTVNRFFPSLGNHDWNTAGAVPYLDYFTLPGNERYYDFIHGPVHLFCIDSDPHEPDGNTGSSVQANWLQSQISASTSTWKIVFFHHAPYSSGTTHGNYAPMQWPFNDWGVHAVLAGHEHNYERIVLDGVTYFVNGAGGKSLYGFGTPVPGSILRYNANYGAQLVDANADSIQFTFINRDGEIIDSYTLHSNHNSIQININYGWNMLSLPLTVPDKKASSLFPSAMSQAYKYSNGSYTGTDSMDRGIGYWIKFQENQTARLQGDSVHIDSIDISEGWNLIGTISDTVTTLSIIKIPEDLIISGFFHFEGTYQLTDTLIPGRGYWLKTESDGTIVIPGKPE